MLVAAFLMLCAVARADSVGPTWEVTAGGIFSALGPGLTAGSEAFALDWTVSFVTYGGDGVFPEYSGTTTMVGILGTVNETMQNVQPNAEKGHLGFWGPDAQAEIDIVADNYYPYGPAPLSLSYVTANPPVIDVPYLWSCDVQSVCEAYGTHVGIGLYAGQGTIVETAREVPVATPEPGSLLLFLSAALLGLPFIRRRMGSVAV